MLRAIPITTVSRTLLDLAGVSSPRTLGRAIHEAEVLRLLDVDDVLDTIERNPGRRGARTLRRLLALPTTDGGGSRFAERFLALCQRHALPTPRLGVHVHGPDRLYEVDALFARERVIAELDGQAVHATARNFQSDRRRDSVLAAEGYLTVRYTWRRIADEPAAVARELREILALRRD